MNKTDLQSIKYNRLTTLERYLNECKIIMDDISIAFIDKDQPIDLMPIRLTNKETRIIYFYTFKYVWIDVEYFNLTIDKQTLKNILNKYINGKIDNIYYLDDNDSLSFKSYKEITLEELKKITFRL